MRRSRKAKTQSEILDSRDGPTPELAQHRDIIHRAGKGGGKRVLTKLERLLRDDYISPEESEAGSRFARDYLIGVVGRAKSCLELSPGGGAAGVPSEERLDAHTRAAAAMRALDDSKSHRAGGVPPSTVIIMCCVEDMPFSTVAVTIKTSDEVAKTRISQHLAVLAMHYAAMDHARGRSTTAHTRQLALRRFEPDVERVD